MGAFFDEYSQSNIVLLDSLKWAVHLFTMTDFEGDKEAEEAAYNYLLDGIDNITADNQMELNLQTYAKRRLQLTLNPENEDLMNAIADVANQCVFYGGPTVLEARGFWKLNSGFFDIFEEDLEADCNMPLYRRAMFEDATETKDKPTIEKIISIDYSLHPNLFKGEGYAHITLGEKEEGILRLYSVDGKIAYEYKVLAGRNELNIGAANLEGGVYIYKVIIDSELKHTGKLVNVR